MRHATPRGCLGSLKSSPIADNVQCPDRVTQFPSCETLLMKLCIAWRPLQCYTKLSQKYLRSNCGSHEFPTGAVSRRFPPTAWQVDQGVLLARVTGHAGGSTACREDAVASEGLRAMKHLAMPVARRSAAYLHSPRYESAGPVLNNN